jgi:hypothetical protein
LPSSERWREGDPRLRRNRAGRWSVVFGI